jgi:enoyl-CoA hydratase/carnithine racemase
MSPLPAFETLQVSVEGPTATVVLFRPGKANAVNRQMLDDLVGLADWLREEPDIAFVILTHHGKVFAAGADLAELRAELDLDDHHRRARVRSMQVVAQEMMRKLENLQQITFAALEGSAYGAGMAIAMAADFRIMSTQAQFVLPESALGMFLTYGCTPRLVAAAGLSRAKRMIMWAKPLDASRAAEWGLVDEIVEPGRTVAVAEQMIDDLGLVDLGAVRLTKQLANAAAPSAFGDITRSEPDLVEAVLGNGTIRERLAGFLDRKH